MYFEATVVFIEEIQMKNGVKEKKVRRSYLVECDSVSVAEAKVNVDEVKKDIQEHIDVKVTEAKEQVEVKIAEAKTKVNEVREHIEDAKEDVKNKIKEEIVDVIVDNLEVTENKEESKV